MPPRFKSGRASAAHATRVRSFAVAEKEASSSFSFCSWIARSLDRSSCVTTIITNSRELTRGDVIMAIDSATAVVMPSVQLSLAAILGDLRSAPGILVAQSLQFRRCCCCRRLTVSVLRTVYRFVIDYLLNTYNFTDIISLLGL